VALPWKSVSEDKGIGLNAWDKDGHVYSAGSYHMARHLTQDSGHNIYLLKDNVLLATIDLADEIKPGVKEVIHHLKNINIKPVMVSGDRKAICDAVAAETGITEVFSEQLPAQKLERIERYSSQAFTAMVGDGINDAPALARATVGVSLSEATQVAIQSSQVILVPGHDLSQLVQAITISRHTLLTIKQNLFWALAYNVVAIPLAAAGFLSPMIGAFSMAFSDVIVIGNSLRLKTKKIF
jgi:Cu+-exporting ATPase